MNSATASHAQSAFLIVSQNVCGSPTWLRQREDGDERAHRHQEALRADAVELLEHRLLDARRGRGRGTQRGQVFLELLLVVALPAAHLAAERRGLEDRERGSERLGTDTAQRSRDRPVVADDRRRAVEQLGDVRTVPFRRRRSGRVPEVDDDGTVG